MDRFDAMQAFVRVVESGSFTKAADTMHVSKTTVTQLVQQLEARLRVKLLHRTTRRVQVTADGAVYYERAVRLLADMDDAETSLSSASAAPRGRLRVDVPSPLARLILVPALPEFHAQYPDIQLDMGVSDRMVDLIGDNVDCVVRGGEIQDQSLIARRVGDLQLGVYAAPSYLSRAGSPVHPHELEDSHHRVVGFLWSSTGKTFPYAMRRGAEEIQVQGRYVLAVDDGNAYLAAGLAGKGRSLAAALHGPPAPGQRRTGAPAGRLGARPHAAVRGLPAQSPGQRQGAGVHRLGGGADGKACAAGAPAGQAAQRGGGLTITAVHALGRIRPARRAPARPQPSTHCAPGRALRPAPSGPPAP